MIFLLIASFFAKQYQNNFENEKCFFIAELMMGDILWSTLCLLLLFHLIMEELLGYIYLTQPLEGVLNLHFTNLCEYI